MMYQFFFLKNDFRELFLDLFVLGIVGIGDSFST